MGLLYDRIRGSCDDQGGTVDCKIPIEAFNMALIAWADGVFTKAKVVSAFSLTAEEVGPGDGTYLTLTDLATWYSASTNKLKFIFSIGQVFRLLEIVQHNELPDLDFTDAQVVNYLRSL